MLQMPSSKPSLIANGWKPIVNVKILLSNLYAQELLDVKKAY
jgi:hypothetical protein